MSSRVNISKNSMILRSYNSFPIQSSQSAAFRRSEKVVTILDFAGCPPKISIAPRDEIHRTRQEDSYF